MDEAFGVKGPGGLQGTSALSQHIRCPVMMDIIGGEHRDPGMAVLVVETFDLEVLHGAVKDALRLGAIGYDAVKHLVLCRIERRPPKLDLDIYPYLPRANVATTAAASYMSLLGGGAS